MRLPLGLDHRPLPPMLTALVVSLWVLHGPSTRDELSMHFTNGYHQCLQRMTDIIHIHSFCHPILCSIDPSSCDLWRQAPILFFVSFPFLSALKPLAMFRSRFLSNPIFPVLSLRCSSSSSHLSTCALSQTCVPPSSCSTSLHLISPQIQFQKYPATFYLSMFFFTCLCWCFPFQTFLLLAELVGSFTQGTSFSSRKQPKESPLPQPCSFHYCPARALVLLGCELKQKLKLTKK